MSIEITEAPAVLWLDEHVELSMTELAALSGLSTADLQHLLDCEALLPVYPAQSVTGEPGVDAGPSCARFSARWLTLARAASRLRDDFDLDTNGLALILQLLSRVDQLEAELRHMRAQHPH